MKVVLDINILISAAIAKGKPRRLLIKGINKEFDIVASKQLLNELKEVISRPKFKLSLTEADKFVSTVKRTVKLVEINSNFKVVEEDPADDSILNVAYDSKADYIVSGDSHLLNLKKFKEIKIVTADEMLKILE
jgi:putative PIN family toxin of toxin-antitoxin system